MAKRRPSGDGMVRKREDGRWEGRIVVGHNDTQKELTARLRKCITAYQGVDLTEQSRLTLSEWLDQWLVSKEGMVRPGTLNGYRGYIENHIRPCLGEKRISQIKAVDIQRFYDMLSRKLASGTVRRIHTTLHGILKAAAQARLIPRNPVEEVTPPKFSYQEKKVLTAEQVEAVKKYVINPVEAREASLDTRATLKMEYPIPTEVEVLDGFNELDEEGLKKFIDENGLAMDLGETPSMVSIYTGLLVELLQRRAQRFFE